MELHGTPFELVHLVIDLVTDLDAFQHLARRHDPCWRGWVDGDLDLLVVKLAGSG